MHIVNIQKTFYKISDFISWQKSGNLILSPFFQRRSIWKPGAKSFLIDTIVRGLPIPIIFVRDRRTNPNSLEPTREVVDGQQRVRTVISYIAPAILPDFETARDAFVVKRTHNRDIAGKSFTDLDVETRHAILDYEFSVHVLPASIDDREIIEIFRRMNSTNYTLTRQELRNANWHGEFKTSAFQLAAEQLKRWRDWNVFSEDDIARMVEVEHTSECVLMILDEGKISGKSWRSIDKAYSSFDNQFPKRNEVERRFRAVMDQIDNCYSYMQGDLVFLKKTLIYTFFCYIYNALFEGSVLAERSTKTTDLKSSILNKIAMKSKLISEKLAPENVLDAAARRTTNPKERLILYKYLQKDLEDAEER